jgi:acetylornithine deacetylase/succinyl-diaminopimelate desuccinylase-like protein
MAAFLLLPCGLKIGASDSSFRSFDHRHDRPQCRAFRRRRQSRRQSESLFGLLRIQSISTDPAYASECRRAGQWLVDELNDLGFDASLRDTTGHPMVVAHHAWRDTGRAALPFYGHYDVQPVDPLDLWTDPPFEPAVKEIAPGRKAITGRGAADDKGQLMTFVEACRAWKAASGSLPCRITILFEARKNPAHRRSSRSWRPMRMS